MKQAMILAAGLGTRLKPLTDTMPKALVPVGGKPLLDINIEKLQQAGYDRFVVNIHHFASQIVVHVHEQQYAPMVHFSDESAQLLETGGGLKKAQSLFRDDEPILIHNVDILDNVDYQWFARQHQPDEDAVLLVSKRKTKRYLLFDNAMRMRGWNNIKSGEVKPQGLDISELRPLAFAGIHVVSPRIFEEMESMPAKFSIIDFYLQAMTEHRIMGYTPPQFAMLDVGKTDTLQPAEEFVKRYL